MKIPAFIQSAYRLFVAIADRLQCVFLLVIRLYWGSQFFMTGKGKLLNIDKTAEFFGSLGLPLPKLQVVLAGSTECFGGLLLAVGLASRLVSVPLAFTMFVAYATADREALMSIFSDTDKFTGATPFLFLFTVLIVLLFGPGRISLDWLICRKCCQPDAKGETRV